MTRSINVHCFIYAKLASTVETLMRISWLYINSVYAPSITFVFIMGAYLTHNFLSCFIKGEDGRHTAKETEMNKVMKSIKLTWAG